MTSSFVVVRAAAARRALGVAICCRAASTRIDGISRAGHFSAAAGDLTKVHIRFGAVRKRMAAVPDEAPYDNGKASAGTPGATA
ncbi:MAG: hypothetical protein M5U08_02625 [Burkholderiales bacterium]|nr:hypothetical protein [Burkholderiales bacterium]